MFWTKGKEIMRKVVLQFFTAVILLSLVSCAVGSEIVHLGNAEAEYEQYTPSEPILPQVIPVEPEEVIVEEEVIEEICIEDVYETTLPHPFAAVLREYMAGYDGDVHAYLATLDDDGTIGVLTTRPTTRALVDYDTGEYAYAPSGTLFYIQDGDLFQIDVSGWLFVAGRYNRLMEHLDAHTHIVEVIYKLKFDRLEISTRLEYFSDDYLSMLFDEYDIEEFIAERDALAEYAREKYGLVAQLPPTFGHMRNTEDQTAQILAMTINCVPSLD